MKTSRSKARAKRSASSRMNLARDVTKPIKRFTLSRPVFRRLSTAVFAGAFLTVISAYVRSTLIPQLIFDRRSAGDTRRAVRPRSRPRAAHPGELHERLVEAMVGRYMRFHRAERLRPGARKLIYTGMGNKHGFGDRFRGVLHAYLCALLSERVLLLAWDDPFPLGTVFASAAGVRVMYDARLDGPGLPPRSVLTRWRPPRGAARRARFPWCDCTLATPGILLSPAPTVVIRTEAPPCLRRLQRALAKHRALPAARALAEPLARWNAVSRRAGGDDRFYALVFRALLRPAPELVVRLRGLHRELEEIVPEREKPYRRGGHRGFISVHARVGYGVGEARAYASRFDLHKKGASIRLIAKCLAKFAARAADEAEIPEPQAFYIAGDTPELSKAFREEIHETGMGTIVMEIGGGRMHSNRMNSSSPMDKEKFIMTAVELFFLSAGEKLVSLSSGFANLARYFGNIPHRSLRVEDCVKIAKLLERA